MENLEQALATIGQMSMQMGINVEEATDAFIRLSKALENGRKEESYAPLHKFRVKSEEVEIDWIS